MKPKKSEIIGWCLFDVANSSYTTVIITVIFGRVFAEIIVGSDSDNSFKQGNFLWSFLLSVSYFITALLGPLFGAMSDVSTKRKRFLGGSVLLCCLATALLYGITPGGVLVAGILIILSNIGFSLSENFISAFLPHISTPQNIGKLSGWSWGLGYFGGLLSLILCQSVISVDVYNLETYDRLRWVGPLTALFFFIFSIPTFLFVREPEVSINHKRKLKEEIPAAYKELINTFKQVHLFRDLARFLLSFFFFIGGLSIVVSFAAIYAAQEVGITGRWQVLFFLIVQVSAAFGAVIFGMLQNRIGALKTVNLTLYIWIATICGIYFLEPLGLLLGIADLKVLFLILGNVAGICMGSTQSASRAIVGMFSPQARSGEFYGFWGLSGKLASVFAIIVFGSLQAIFSLRTAMLFCISFFVIGLVLNYTIDEQRGRDNVKNHQ